jgi:hypothetical protein
MSGSGYTPSHSEHAREAVPPHLRGDEKSAEAIERKRVERAPSGKRVRKIQKEKRLDVGGQKEAGNNQRSGKGAADSGGDDLWQTRERIAKNMLSAIYYFSTVRMNWNVGDKR